MISGEILDLPTPKNLTMDAFGVAWGMQDYVGQGIDAHSGHWL
jgi:hypothetical protein